MGQRSALLVAVTPAFAAAAGSIASSAFPARPCKSGELQPAYRLAIHMDDTSQLSGTGARVPLLAALAESGGSLRHNSNNAGTAVPASVLKPCNARIACARTRISGSFRD